MYYHDHRKKMRWLFFLDISTCSTSFANEFKKFWGFEHKLTNTHGFSLSSSCPSIAQMLSTMLYSRRFFPFYTYNILAGLDSEGTAYNNCYELTNQLYSNTNIQTHTSVVARITNSKGFYSWQPVKVSGNYWQRVIFPQVKVVCSASIQLVRMNERSIVQQVPPPHYFSRC